MVSLLAVVALTAGYEAVREASRRYEAKQSAVFENMPSKLCSMPTHCSKLIARQDQHSERSSLLPVGSSIAAQEKQTKIVKAAFYGVQVFYSFFIM